MLAFLAICSGLLAIGSHLPYLRDILAGKTRPERASWLIWSVLGSIAFTSQLAKGATVSLWLNAGDTLGVLLVFILSINTGVGGLAKKDVVSLFLATIGIALWLLTNEPLLALVIVILVDLTGAWLTVIKAYEEPETETLSTWVLCSIGGFLGAASVGELNFVLLLYPLYIGIINGLTGLAIFLGKQNHE